MPNARATCLPFGALACALWALAAQPHLAQAQVNAAQAVQGSLQVEADALQPNTSVRVGVQFTLAPGWHIYWRNPGDAGFATELDLKAEAASFGELSWPPPAAFHENDKVTTYGYTERTMLVSAMQVAADAKGELVIEAEARYLACNITCNPGQFKLRRTLKVGDVAAPASAADAAAFAQFDAQMAAPEADFRAKQGHGLLQALSMLLAAFVGGMLLNAMPCVLPVLALKAASLAQLGADPAKARRHGWAYALGVVGSMQVLALLVLVARTLGQEVGWGFQFQEPLFVAGVAVALVLFAANLLGAFELTPEVNRLAAAHDRAQGLQRSVLEGVLAVLVATPCSTPFLGTAMAFALGEGAAMVVATFAAVGLGLAAPYVLLVQIPYSRKLLPRPGAWMLGLKTALGYSLLATAIWLAWVLGRARGADALVGLLIWAWAAAAGAQVLGAVLRRVPQRGGLALACLIASLVAVGGQLLPWFEAPATRVASADAAGEQQPFSEEAVRAAVANRRYVFVDFTADWCVTCKYNERTVLASEAVRTAFATKKVLVLKADWTQRDDALLRQLQAHGRAGVPMYLLYRPDRPTPTLLPEVLTQAMVLRALGEG